MKQPLWIPGERRKQESNMTSFMQEVNDRFGLKLSGYNELYRWSIENMEDFWGLIWDYGRVRHSKSFDSILKKSSHMIGSRWFEGATLNFAENLLRFRDNRTALVFKGEGREPRRITYAGLYRQAASLQKAMLKLGIKAGDRVAGFMPNMIETVVAMLAATATGAIWSSCSPDFGTAGALDRFGQIEPRLLFTANGYYYSGKEIDSTAKAKELARNIPSIEKVVVIPYLEREDDLEGLPSAEYFDDLVSAHDSEELHFEQLPFDHPVYIMYSSGTTGAPKCIVHGAGGTLLQHLKELVLHTDLKREDVIFYFTTCGWMMWNWLISSLAVGATVVLFDGSPFYPEEGALFRMCAEENITVFGTSARYLSALEQKGVRPVEEYALGSLRAILSTGSPLSAGSFRYVYRHIKSDLCLSSISGGTDIISCFALGNPLLPVYPGELQCRGLGMKVEAYDENGRPVINRKGELVCTAPFPSMPVYFWNDPGDQKYITAYFERYPNVWHHGDYIELNDNEGVVIYGRSDATLNPGGVRIGTAEIYRLVETFPEVEDSLVVGQSWQGDERVILFVKMDRDAVFSEELAGKIKQGIKQNISPRHVPALVIPVADIPYTINGKKVEIAVRKIIHRQEVTNREALANPESLELYSNIPELK